MLDPSRAFAGTVGYVQSYACQAILQHMLMACNTYIFCIYNNVPKIGNYDSIATTINIRLQKYEPKPSMLSYILSSFPFNLGLSNRYCAASIHMHLTLTSI